MHADGLIEVGRSATLATAAILFFGCAPAPPPTAAPAPLPPLPVQQVVVDPIPLREAPSDDPLAGLPPGEPVSLTAADVDVRALLTALAEAADLSLVMGPDVQGRLSVNLVDVPATEALKAILAEAGLMVAPPPLTSPWERPVFYTFPVDIETADVELIRQRFGVSREMAEWIVESRIR